MRSGCEIQEDRMKKITVAGNSLADIIKRIDAYPNKGMLSKISEVIPSVGGCVPNTGITLKKLAPDELDVSAISRVGKDENGKFIVDTLRGYGLDTGRMVFDGTRPTSFTDVMTLPNGERTFFCLPAANDAFCEEDVRPDTLDCSLFHIGYLLLLKELDGPDKEYGTKMARLLHDVQARGIETCIDVVSEEGERFSQVVGPALRYCDYIVVNEIEAGRITGIRVREGDRLIRRNLRAACEALMQAGVRKIAAVHCPEMGCACDAHGNFAAVPSLNLPKGYIVGSVGAGDAFCAGMLYSFASGMTPEEGLRLASATAASNLHASDSVGGAQSLEDTMALEKKFGRLAI